MISTTRKWLYIGAAAAVIGSFLPWVQQGDLFSIYTCGLRVYWVYGAQTYPLIDDNGGLLVVLLTLVIVAPLALRSGFTRTSLFVSQSASVALVLRVLFHILKILIARIEAPYAGAPVVWIGLWLVFASSLFLLNLTLRARIHSHSRV